MSAYIIKITYTKQERGRFMLDIISFMANFFYVGLHPTLVCASKENYTCNYTLNEFSGLIILLSHN